MNFPKMFRVRQSFDRTQAKDIPGTVIEELARLNLHQKVKKGQRVAITAGSRGVANMAIILKSAVEHLRTFGADPFIFPAMGSHAGATSEGQSALLAHYQITEAFTGAPVISSMDVVQISQTESGVPVYIDRQASQADWIMVVNRIKPHTKFKGFIESGLMKMMAIGMGKQQGAEHYHKAAIQYTFQKIIVDAGREVIQKAPILCGLGIVENGYDETAIIAALRPKEIEEREKELLTLAKKMLPQLPFNDIDLLIVDEIGKDVSGTGMDPNVTGRNRDILGVFPHPAQVKRVFIRDFTKNSGGNAIGLGLADLTTKRLVDKINYAVTYMNCITAISLEKGAVPMHFETDRQAMEVGLGSIGLIPPEEAKIIRIKNTLLLDEVEVSTAYQREFTRRPNLEVLAGPRPMEFDGQGNLLPLQVHGISRKGDL